MRSPRETNGIAALVGTPHLDRDLFNACAVLSDGEVEGGLQEALPAELRRLRRGSLLPVRARPSPAPARARRSSGVTICEDIWQPGPPATDLALAGAHVVANVSASPFHLGKGREREEMLATRARDNACWVALVNAVGGQDELVFDGQQPRARPGRRVVARGSGLRGSARSSSTSSRRRRSAAGFGTRAGARSRARARSSSPSRSTSARRAPPRELVHPLVAPELDRLEEMRRAVELGLRDYVEKNGFHDVVLGMSGGIDSALTAAIAVEALGAGARRLRLHALPVLVERDAAPTRAWRRKASARASWRSRSSRSPSSSSVALAEPFAGTEPGVAEENVQARIRGTLLMALSNKFGWLLVATGNKSELSVGYATLYGDMAGGFAPLKDVFKTDVFLLARHLNERAGRELVPSLGDRARPERGATCRPARRGLPAALSQAGRRPRGVRRARPVAGGASAGRVRPRDRRARALALVDRAEYKRRQAPPGVKLRPKAFGRDRRVPITNRWVG